MGRLGSPGPRAAQPGRIHHPRMRALLRNSKYEIRNTKQIQKPKSKKTMGADDPKYDLEERAFQFARRVRGFVKHLPRTVCNIEDVKQLVRASGSVGANYIEANEALSKKDFRMRIKISRKEAKESAYWLRLVDTAHADLDAQRSDLIGEAIELMKIFGAILRKSE
jgi:four helix bundle protein